MAYPPMRSSLQPFVCDVLVAALRSRVTIPVLYAVTDHIRTTTKRLTLRYSPGQRAAYSLFLAHRKYVSAILADSALAPQRLAERAHDLMHAARACGFDNHAARTPYYDPIPLRNSPHNACPLPVDAVMDFYTHLYTPLPPSPDRDLARGDLLDSARGRVSANTARFIGSLFTATEVERAMRRLDPGKAAGPDGLSYEVWKLVLLVSAEFFARLLNTMLATNSSDYFPLNQPAAWGTLLYKGRGHTMDVSRYRPLSILNASVRIMDAVVAHRLQQASADLFRISQLGFLKCSSTWQAALLVHLSIASTHGLLSGNECLILLSQDQRKAYDMVNRQWLFRSPAIPPTTLLHSSLSSPDDPVCHLAYVD